MINPIQIVFITDNNYILPTSVAIQSLIKNKNSETVYDIHVLAIDVLKEKEDKVLALKREDASITFHDFENKYEGIGTKHLYVSKAALFKFDIANVLPTLNKVLYLDGDIVVNSDLSELYNIDIENVYAGVVKDLICIVRDKDHERINQPTYWNSGVMLLNLEKIRNNNIPDALKTVNLQYSFDKHHDQDTLNRVFNQEVKYLSPKYNYFTFYQDYKDKDLQLVFELSKEEVKAIRKNAAIIHYAGSKPWKNKNALYSKLWLQYYNELPYKDEIKYEKKIKKKFKLFGKDKDGNNRTLYILGFKIRYAKKSDYIHPSEQRLVEFGIKIDKQNDIYTYRDISVLRTWNHADILSDLFLFSSYDYIFKPNNQYLMLDIGMNTGITSLYMSQKPEITQIYGFEPFKPIYDIAQKHFHMNEKYSSKIKSFNYGLGDSEKQIEVNFDPVGHSGMSTIIDRFEDKEDLRKEIANIKKASDILKPILENNIDKKVFMKIDCEGAEFEIIPDLESAGLLKQIDIIIMEWHFKYPNEIIELLHSEGFECFVSQSKNDLGLIRAVRVNK